MGREYKTIGGLSRSKGNWITDTATHTNTRGWLAIQAITDTVATVVSTTIIENSIASNSTTHSTRTIPAGIVIQGFFNSITLASGTVIAYES